LASFVSAFFFYVQYDLAAVLLFAISWIGLPSLALRDNITFDGRRITRTGILSRLMSRLNGSRRRLKIADVEHVETHAVRSVRRGPNVHYRYRTVIHGKGLSISISSGGENYRRLIKALLASISDNILDIRSKDLRDYLADPGVLRSMIQAARLPSADALEKSFRISDWRALSRISTIDSVTADGLESLRELANQLRISGYLVQAIEAFRKLLRARPADPKILFEFARCLHSYAGSNNDAALERRALAAVRLSEQRVGDDDGDLLVRLGEWYFQIGEWRRAGRAFLKALDTAGESFRVARGMAEIALREGKIAHVIHQFAAAGRMAESPSLRRWSRSEADYFANLNSDDEYRDLEISRVKLLEGVSTGMKSALRITIFALPFVFIGVILEDWLIANIGWAVSGISLAVYAVLLVGSKTLASRIPYELVENDGD
jgi:tetratricopeptide (TPR) repeat protein